MTFYKLNEVVVLRIKMNGSAGAQNNHFWLICRISKKKKRKKPYFAKTEGTVLVNVAVLCNKKTRFVLKLIRQHNKIKLFSDPHKQI